MPRIFSGVGTPRISSGVISVQFFLPSRNFRHCSALAAETGFGSGLPGKTSKLTSGFFSPNKDIGALNAPAAFRREAGMKAFALLAGSASAGLVNWIGCCAAAGQAASTTAARPNHRARKLNGQKFIVNQQPKTMDTPRQNQFKLSCTRWLWVPNHRCDNGFPPPGRRQITAVRIRPCRAVYRPETRPFSHP